MVNKNKIRIFFIIGVIAIIGVVLFFIIKSNKPKSKIEEQSGFI